MKKICMITPPSIFLLDERVFMHLGILKVAANLEKNGWDVEMLDLSGIQDFEEMTRVQAKNTGTRIFALTATTPQMPAARKVVEAIRSVRKDAKIILGGPHITLVMAAYKKEVKHGKPGRAAHAYEQCAEMFDVLVAGDGEEAIFAAAADDAPKFVDGDDPKTPLFLSNAKLNELPFPARHLVDVDSYHYTIDGVRALSVIAQFGCPFSCGFCGGRESPMLRHVRMRTSKNVVDELVELYRTYGVRGFMFYDDELNVNPRMIELMNSIRDAQMKLGVEFKLRGFIKSQLFTDEQAKAMAETGFRWILVGFESGSEKILENMNKKSTCEENTRCVEIARRHNLKVKALMSVGHPGESEETIRKTHDWLIETKPDDFDVSIITTYPGTPYYDQAVKVPGKEDVWAYTFEKTGDKLYSIDVDYTKIADYYKGDPDGGYRAYVYTDHLSAERLVELRGQMENEVRKKLNIPFNPGAPRINFEHSMGQFGGKLPASILRSTSGTKKS